MKVKNLDTPQRENALKNENIEADREDDRREYRLKNSSRCTESRPAWKRQQEMRRNKQQLPDQKTWSGKRRARMRDHLMQVSRSQKAQKPDSREPVQAQQMQAGPGRTNSSRLTRKTLSVSRRRKDARNHLMR